MVKPHFNCPLEAASERREQKVLTFLVVAKDFVFLDRTNLNWTHEDPEIGVIGCLQRCIHIVR